MNRHERRARGAVFLRPDGAVLGRPEPDAFVRAIVATMCPVALAVQTALRTRRAPAYLVDMVPASDDFVSVTV